MSDEDTDAQLDRMCRAIDALEGTNDEVLGLLYDIQEHIDEKIEALEAAEISEALRNDSDPIDATSLDDNFPDGDT